MSVKWVQDIYDGIKNRTAPKWLKDLIRELNDLMISVLKKVGQDYMAFLESKIMEAAQNDSWSSRQKFNYVFDEAKKGFVRFSITLKDNELNSLINVLVSKLKLSGIIA